MTNTIEQKELYQFLSNQAPFSELVPAAAHYAVNHLQIIY